jgi:hypothetical protein
MSKAGVKQEVKSKSKAIKAIVKHAQLLSASAGVVTWKKQADALVA